MADLAREHGVLLSAPAMTLMVLSIPELDRKLPGHSATSAIRTGFINAFQPGRHVPQGLKPACLLAVGGTAEAVPFQNKAFPSTEALG